MLALIFQVSAAVPPEMVGDFRNPNEISLSEKILSRFITWNSTNDIALNLQCILCVICLSILIRSNLKVPTPGSHQINPVPAPTGLDRFY